MTVQRRPHDQFFKRMMSDPDIAKDFFSAHLPATVLKKIRLDSLEMEPASFVDEALKERESDMLYQVPLCDDEPAYIYLLLEHQSSSDPLMAFRLQYYIMQILDRHIRQYKELSPLPLPLIFPMVLYNGAESFSAKRDIFTLFGEQEELARTVFLKPFTLIDVSTIADEEMRNHQWAAILEWCLRYSIARDFLPYIKSLGFFLRDLAVQPGDNRLITVLNYIAESMETPEKAKAALEALAEELPYELEKNVMTIAEQLRREGRQEGRLEGKAESMEATFKALNLLKQGCAIETVSRETGLSNEILQRLWKEILH